MEIKILGTGCASCKATYETVKTLVAEMNITASVVKEEDMMKIMSYNVMTLPAIVVDENVVAKGKKTAQEIKEILSKL